MMMRASGNSDRIAIIEALRLGHLDVDYASLQSYGYGMGAIVCAKSCGYHYWAPAEITRSW